MEIILQDATSTQHQIYKYLYLMMFYLLYRALPMVMFKTPWEIRRQVKWRGWEIIFIFFLEEIGKVEQSMIDGLEEFQQQWVRRVLSSCLVLALWSLCWRYHKPEDENIQHVVMDIDIISCLRRTDRPCKICPLSITTLKATSQCENFETGPVDCWYSLIERKVECSSDPHLRKRPISYHATLWQMRVLCH